MSTKTAVFARSNSSRSSIRPLSEFQLARLPLRAVGTIITLYLRVPKVWRGKKMKKKKKRVGKKLLSMSLKKQMLRVGRRLVNISVKKKKEKKCVDDVYLFL